MVNPAKQAVYLGVHESFFYLSVEPLGLAHSGNFLSHWTKSPSILWFMLAIGWAGGNPLLCCSLKVKQ